MREIKFRLWNGNNYEYLNNTLSDIPYYKLFCNTPDKNIGYIEQYTGLKDKNGVEIYEGDIVTADWHWTEPHTIVLPDDYYSFVEFAMSDEMTIIGNIHETPELLK